MNQPTPLKKFNCPICAISHEIKVAHIKWVACQPCGSSLRVTDDGLVDEGALPNFPQIESGLDLGIKGVVRGRPFTVIGNVIFTDQTVEGRGWHEWLLMFDDGSTLWLEDEDGVLTLYAESYDVTDQVPLFETIILGEEVRVDSFQFTPSEKGTVKVITYQGQVPKHGIVNDYFHYFVGSFRNYLATVEYTSQGDINLFFGISLKLSDLDLSR